MRITIVSCVYPPEPVISAQTSAQIAETLAKAGNAVAVVTSFPSRPSGKLVTGYSRRFVKREPSASGVEIVRCFSTLSPESRLFSRWLENLTFGLTAGWQMLTMKRPDVIYANTWPIIATGILFLVARLRGIALVISIQDVYPEALVVQRRIRDDGLLARFMRWIDGCIARHSAHVIVISERFAEVYRDQRGVPADRVHVIPNWGDERAVTSDSGGAQLRAEMGIPPDAFLMVYGGNVGVAAGLEGVIQALDNWPLDTPRPYLLVAGAGASLDACRTLAARVAGDHIRFLTPWPTEKTGPVHSAADILVLPTQGAQSMVSVPSKLISYMLSGRPVIAQAIPGSDLARTVEDSRCGWVVEPGSPEVLATTIREVMALPEIERVQRGEAGRAFACHYLTRAACLPQVVRVLEQAASTEVQQDARV